MVREQISHNILSSHHYKVRNHSIINIIIFIIYGLVGIGMVLFQENQYMMTTMFYTVTILSSVTFASLYQNTKIPFLSSAFYVISFLILFFVLGFRNYSGIDDTSYKNIFFNVSEHGFVGQFIETKLEPGYLLLNYFVSLFTDNYLYMQLLSSFIPLALFYYRFKKNSSFMSISLAVFLLATLIYFQMLSVSLIRMFIAVSIVFNAYSYIHQKKLWKYIVVILVASTFHYSALAMLLLCYFCINTQNLSRKSKRFIIITFLLLPFVFIGINKLLIPILGGRYAAYTSINDFNVSVATFDTIPVILLLLWFFKKYNDGNQSKNALLLKTFVTIYSLSFVFSFYGGMFSLGRLLFYSVTALFIAAPMISYKLNGTAQKITFDSVIIIYGFMYVYWTQLLLESHFHSLFPYKNLFFNF